MDPGDLHLLGFSWHGQIFVDRVLAMGLRSATMMCQHVTSAVSYIQANKGFEVVNYVDDFGGCEKPERAWEAFMSLGDSLEHLGLEEATEKAVLPSTEIEFLGVWFNSLKLTIEVTQDRLQEIKLLLESWLNKKSASKRYLRSLVGKLI